MDHCCHSSVSHSFRGRSFILCTKEAGWEVSSGFQTAGSSHARRFDSVMFCRCCQQSGSSQSKSAPVSVFLLYQFTCCVLAVITTHFCDVHFQKEEMEEVEPYASYVQRVNDLYNSPADIFT